MDDDDFDRIEKGTSSFGDYSSYGVAIILLVLVALGLDYIVN